MRVVAAGTESSAARAHAVLILFAGMRRWRSLRTSRHTRFTVAAATSECVAIRVQTRLQTSLQSRFRVLACLRFIVRFASGFRGRAFCRTSRGRAHARIGPCGISARAVFISTTAHAIVIELSRRLMSPCRASRQHHESNQNPRPAFMHLCTHFRGDSAAVCYADKLGNNPI
jgi:hypothetical protein